MAHTRKGLLIATLGSEAQVVTAVLDLLEQMGEQIEAVQVVHSLGAHGSAIAAAVERLRAAFGGAGFADPPYAGRIALHLAPLYDEIGRPLTDVDTPTAARAAFRLLYRLVRAAKLDGRRVHLSIAGGRKTMAVFGLAAAQLLFDEDDRLWHLVSGGEYLESKRLHPQPGDDVHLIQIPLILWGQAAPVVRLDAEGDDPYQALERARRLQLAERLDAARAFVLGALTPAERRAASLLVQEGLSDAEIAARLSLSPRTVERHLRTAYQKAADHWELPDVSRAQLVALLNLYFITAGEGKLGVSTHDGGGAR